PSLSLSTPAAAVGVNASCGCPVYVGFHFYAYDCMPEAGTGGYETLQERLDATARIMELLGRSGGSRSLGDRL
ncbi:Hypothetical protein SCF082_LOCUS32003, partial [Durusdinium trenchii]